MHPTKRKRNEGFMFNGNFVCVRIVSGWHEMETKWLKIAETKILGVLCLITTT